MTSLSELDVNTCLLMSFLSKQREWIIHLLKRLPVTFTYFDSMGIFNLLENLKTGEGTTFYPFAWVFQAERI